MLPKMNLSVRVKYLDINYDNPITNDDGVPIAQMKEELTANSFVKLTSQWQAGTSIAHYEDGLYYFYQVIKIENEKILALGWAGEIDVLNKSECVAIPIKPEISAGDSVQVLYIGSFAPGIVTKYNKSSGRAFVDVEFYGNKESIVVSIGNITKDLVL